MAAEMACLFYSTARIYFRRFLHYLDTFLYICILTNHF